MTLHLSTTHVVPVRAACGSNIRKMALHNFDQSKSAIACVAASKTIWVHINFPKGGNCQTWTAAVTVCGQHLPKKHPLLRQSGTQLVPGGVHHSVTPLEEVEQPTIGISSIWVL